MEAYKSEIKNEKKKVTFSFDNQACNISEWKNATTYTPDTFDINNVLKPIPLRAKKNALSFDIK